MELECVQAGWGSYGGGADPLPYITYEAVSIWASTAMAWADPYIDQYMGDQDEKAFAAWDRGDYGTAAAEWAWGWTDLLDNMAHDLSLATIQTLENPNFWSSWSQSFGNDVWYISY